ncbi:hypothetical protein O181_044431 [Austropuccinia psidii MF-1]|uniref:Integrase catalytic domain-containing protein n=1 Tax=Austropuccinia psidii MF-1 TaxID=1389203 RepID=A0A9Q3HGV6_9BASI|nr:hypothetical protein [Austropuccinia psidii MF-1]
MGHRGENQTYIIVKEIFWWQGIKKIVNKWVKSYKSCQKRSHYHTKEEGKISLTSTSFERVSMDAVHVKALNLKYLVVARYNFSGWPETVLIKLTAASVSEWLTTEFIFRYGAPKEVTDGGPEFCKELQDAVRKEGSKIRVTTPYYPESQGMVERGHKQLGML